MERIPPVAAAAWDGSGGEAKSPSSRGLLAIELRDRLLLLRTSVLAPDRAVSVRGGTSDIGMGLDATEGPAAVAAAISLS